MLTDLQGTARATGRHHIDSHRLGEGRNMRAYDLGMYEKAVPDALPLEEKMRVAKNAGYDHLEFCVDLNEDRAARIYWSKEERRSWRSLAEDMNMPFTTFSLSLLRKYPLGSPEPGAWEKAKEILERGAELARDLGSRIILVNGYDVYDEPSTSDTQNRFYENLPKLAEICAANGVVIGIENAEAPFGNTVGKIRHIIEKANSPYVQIYADIANSANAAGGDTETAIRDLRSGSGHIVAMHLKDMVVGDYRYPYYGKGQVDFEKSIQLAAEMNVRIFTAELFCFDETRYAEVAGNVSRFLRGYLDKAF